MARDTLEIWNGRDAARFVVGNETLVRQILRSEVSGDQGGCGWWRRYAGQSTSGARTTHSGQRVTNRVIVFVVHISAARCRLVS